jgi:hypothetical protein
MIALPSSAMMQDGSQVLVFPLDLLHDAKGIDQDLLLSVHFNPMIFLK